MCGRGLFLVCSLPATKRWTWAFNLHTGCCVRPSHLSRPRVFVLAKNSERPTLFDFGTPIWFRWGASGQDLNGFMAPRQDIYWLDALVLKLTWDSQGCYGWLCWGCYMKLCSCCHLQSGMQPSGTLNDTYRCLAWDIGEVQSLTIESQYTESAIP